MNIGNRIDFPETALVRQQLHQAPIDGIARQLQPAAGRLLAGRPIRSGQSVAVGVGSRGISRLDEVVHQTLRLLEQGGLKPVIVPAMGSHGGGTSRGQRQVLEKLGISEAAMGVPIAAEMDTDCIGSLKDGTQIHFARTALQADHLVVINRVKLHTKFRAPVESGLCKMLTIGLGKAEGAAEFHRRAVHSGFGIIEDAARIVLNSTSILFGVALLEDGCGQLSRIETVGPAEWIETEKRLLTEAAGMMGRIPFEHIDVLVVDRIGKDISGIGMDSNVTGRHRDLVGDFYSAPFVKRIFVRDLTPATGGNANGIGLADATTRRLAEAVDREKTYKNAITAISPEKAAIPICFDTDREAVAVCIGTAGVADPRQARLVRISSTKSLELLQVSTAFAPEIESKPNLALVSPWQPMGFDAHGNLLPWAEEDE
ncbi:MAG: [Fe-S]-binding protein [Deltaproteobacteria bacterium SG8_13]|nr:MAG: [Fe-S]-binding protein [Deltaproteobacteria bacterium SG8_13]